MSFYQPLFYRTERFLMITIFSCKKKIDRDREIEYRRTSNTLVQSVC